MPDSMFYDSSGLGIIIFFSFFYFFVKVITTVFVSIKEMNSVVLSLQHQWNWENLILKRTKADEID